MASRGGRPRNVVRRYFTVEKVVTAPEFFCKYMHEMLGARCCRTRRRQPCCRFPPIMSMSACTRRMIGDVLRRNSTSI